MSTVTIEVAQSQLQQLIDSLKPGEELLISMQGQPRAILTRLPEPRWPCKAGSAQGKILFMADDFDAPLEDFKEYME